MDDVLGPRQIELKVHGLSAEDHGRVAPRLFASKLKQRVNALGSADQIANGEKTHQYVLANMHMSEPTALLKEISLDEQEERVTIPVLNDAVEGIKTNDARVARLAPVVRRVSLLTGGAEKQFGFAEVRTAIANIIRIDEILRKRAQAAREQTKGSWHQGAVEGLWMAFWIMLNFVEHCDRSS